MKADTTLKLYHTDGDTYPIPVDVQLKTDTGKVPVADAATVTLHIKADPVIILTGASQGSGLFAFPTASIPTLGTAKIDCEIQVDDGSQAGVYTIARGVIFISSQIA